MVIFQGRLFARLCGLNPDSPVESTAFERILALFHLPILLTASNVASLVRRSNKKKSFT